MKSKKIIVAVSMEPATQRPLQKLREFNFLPDCEIQLIHVAPLILSVSGTELSIQTSPSEEERPKLEKNILNKLSELEHLIFPNHQNVISKVLFDSNEKAAFNDYVAVEKADFVVIATRGKHGHLNFFDSSFAQHQLNHSPANVIILR